jgi:hypothetical protein
VLRPSKLSIALAFVTASLLATGAAQAANALAKCKVVPKVDLAVVGKLRTTALNRFINAGYGALAQCFQAIVEGNPAASASFGRALPNWFAFAPYASRAVGSSEYGLLRAMSSASALSMSGGLASLIDLLSLKPLKTFVTDLMSAMSLGAKGGNLGALANPLTLESSTKCMAKAIYDAPARGLVDKAKMVAGTLVSMLEDGNRRIYSDIGSAGSAYLKWRQGQSSVTPAAVLTQFGPSRGGDATKIQAIYDYAMQHIADSPQPTDFEAALTRGQGATCRETVPVGIALYEAAGTTSDSQARDRYISFGNNLLAYCEQHDVVQPAFTPGRVVAGETDRTQVMRCMTPTVRLLFRSLDWTFSSYCSKRSVDITQKNWGAFSDRWAPILDSFKTVYGRPSAPWPMPHPDAAHAP